MSISRRDFVKTAGAVVASQIVVSSPLVGFARGAESSSQIRRLQSFDYSGVTLAESRLRAQFSATRDFYFNIPNDDILKGFRKGAGLPAPGEDMGGTRSLVSSQPREGGAGVNPFGGTFGQWLSGMARIYKATGDNDIRDKAVYLMTEWGKTFSAIVPTYTGTGGHYGFDKTVCGLVDLARYTGNADARVLLDRITDWGIKNLNRSRLLPDALVDGTKKPLHTSGPPPSGGEWYTLAENLYRAYELTGDSKYRSFAEVWHYPQYWTKFTVPGPADIHDLHAYSHVNTLSSAAMAYGVSGDPQFLKVITGAYDHFQEIQTYATGGYGPMEKLIKPDDGSLGLSVEYEGTRLGTGSSFETGCGSWAVFKLGRYLIEFTGDARYGDWIERILYNGISSALPMADHQNPFFDDIWTIHGWGPDRGRTFYYSDYRLGGARKEYYWGCWPCCSGTYIQDVVDYHNLIYFQDPQSLYVNLFVPSKVEWTHEGTAVTVTQKTDYPESEVTALTIETPGKATFDLKLRVPPWAEGASIKVNGKAFPVAVTPNTWASVNREWSSGDVVEYHLPMQLRTVPIDKQHPNRVAIAYGPVVLVQEQTPTLVLSKNDPHAGFSQADKPLQFVGKASDRPTLKPFYSIGYATPYAMYFNV